MSENHCLLLCYLSCNKVFLWSYCLIWKTAVKRLVLTCLPSWVAPSCSPRWVVKLNGLFEYFYTMTRSSHNSAPFLFAAPSPMLAPSGWCLKTFVCFNVICRSIKFFYGHTATAVKRLVLTCLPSSVSPSKAPQGELSMAYFNTLMHDHVFSQ